MSSQDSKTKASDFKKCCYEKCEEPGEGLMRICDSHRRACICGEEAIPGWGYCIEGYYSLPTCVTQGCRNKVDWEVICGEPESLNDMEDQCDSCLLGSTCFHSECSKDIESINSCKEHMKYPACIEPECIAKVEDEGDRCIGCDPHYCNSCYSYKNPSDSGWCDSCFVYGKCM